MDPGPGSRQGRGKGTFAADLLCGGLDLGHVKDKPVILFDRLQGCPKGRHMAEKRRSPGRYTEKSGEVDADRVIGLAPYCSQGRGRRVGLCERPRSHYVDLIVPGKGK